MGATSVLRATAPFGVEAVRILFLCSLEPLDAGVIFRVEGDVVAVFASAFILADHPNTAFKGAVSSVEVLSCGKLADNLL